MKLVRIIPISFSCRAAQVPYITETNDRNTNKLISQIKIYKISGRN